MYTHCVENKYMYTHCVKNKYVYTHCVENKYMYTPCVTVPEKCRALIKLTFGKSCNSMYTLPWAL